MNKDGTYSNQLYSCGGIQITQLSFDKALSDIDTIIDSMENAEDRASGFSYDHVCEECEHEESIPFWEFNDCVEHPDLDAAIEPLYNIRIFIERLRDLHTAKNQ